MFPPPYPPLFFRKERDSSKELNLFDFFFFLYWFSAMFVAVFRYVYLTKTAQTFRTDADKKYGGSAHGKWMVH